MSELRAEQLRTIRKRAADWLLKIPGVHVVGIGGREKAGQATGELVLKVFVERKRPTEGIPVAERIPAQIEGIGVDVVQAPRFGPCAVAGIAATSIDDEQFLDADEGWHRPIVGGLQISGAGLPGPGTLGFLATIAGPQPRVVGVTNQHALLQPGAPAADRVMGQPNTDVICCGCYKGVFGKHRAGEGHYDNDVDAGLVTLDPGTQWRAEIADVGVVRGRHDFTDPNEVKNLDYQVKKRGRTTLLTGGTIQAIDGDGVSPGGRSFTRAIIIKPNAASPLPAGSVSIFAARGDSGAAVLNADDEIVGLLFAASPDPTGLGWGAATQIADVIKKFHDANSIDLTIATATSAGVTQTVPGAAATAPGALPNARVRQVQVDLSRTAFGRNLAHAWMRHSPEIAHLLATNRRLAARWRRAKGPLLMQHAIRWLDDGNSPFPAEIEGAASPECMSAALDAFGTHGSPRLQGDIASLRPWLAAIPGRSYQSLLGELSGKAVPGCEREA